jgi:hypothetical protein
MRRVLPLLLALQVEKLENMPRVEVQPLDGKLHHVQGIDIEGERLWVTSVHAVERKGYLHLFDRSTGRMLTETEVQEGKRIHPGGIALWQESIWIPVAEYDRQGTTSIQKRDKHTLRLQRSFEVPDHIGCVAVDSDRIVGGNWDSLQFYVWTPAGRLIRKVDNRTGNRYQDIKIAGGKLVASGKLSPREGAIDWLDLETFRLIRRIDAGMTDRDVVYTNEGMALLGRRLYLLPEDGPSRVFVFDLKQ